MNKSKITHTISIFVPGNKSVVPNFEFYGDYNSTINDAINKLKTLDADMAIYLLWVAQSYTYNPRLGVYCGNNDLKNILVKMPRTTSVTVAEAIELLKNTRVDGSPKIKNTFKPSPLAPVETEVLPELIDEIHGDTEDARRFLSEHGYL